MNIDGLGESLVAQLVQSGLIKNVADLYSNVTEESLLALERMGTRSASKLVKAIAQTTTRPLYRLIFGLGIPSVGETTAKALAAKFKSIDNIMRASPAALTAIDDVGPVCATNISKWFRTSANLRLIERLRLYGLTVEDIVEELPQSTALAGTVFVFTGALSSMSREAAGEHVTANGGKIGTSVSRKTTHLVVGLEPGSKLEHARELGTTVLTEEDFLKLIGRS